MTSSRIKRSEGDNASECDLGTDEGCAEVLDGATSVSLGRIELSGTIPAPAAEVVDASVVERVDKGGGPPRTLRNNRVCYGQFHYSECQEEYEPPPKCRTVGVENGADPVLRVAKY